MSSTAPEKKRRTMNPTEPLKKRRKSTEPLKKKRRKSNPTTEPEKKSPTPDSTSISILSIPDELLLICIARVSRLYYPTLSLVSKRFRSLVASPELYKTRSLSGRTESCLYVAFDLSRGSRWFTLSRNPDDSYSLTRVLTTPNTSRRARFQSLVAVGSDIYNIAECESILSSVSSRVSILDCRSHTWRQGPSFPVELLRSFTATVVDRMIYVAGSYRDGDGKIRESVKVLDIDTQTWDHVPIPGCQFFCKESACIDGKFHLVTDEGLVAYDSKEGRWSTVARGGGFSTSDSYCGIGNVFYCGRDGWLRWFDTEARRWRELRGLVGLPKIPTREYNSCGVRLADYGGKLALLWEEPFPDTYYFLSVIPSDKKMIWCAVIALERRSDSEIWGEVEWFGRVLDVPRSRTPFKALAATV